jgi:hypothetical protein
MAVCLQSLAERETLQASQLVGKVGENDGSSSFDSQTFDQVRFAACVSCKPTSPWNDTLSPGSQLQDDVSQGFP